MSTFDRPPPRRLPSPGLPSVRSASRRSASTRSSSTRSATAALNSRRRLIQGLVATGAVGPFLAACARTEETGFTPNVPTTVPSISDTDRSEAGRRTTGAVDGRVLVVVDLQGGNDGLSMVVPASSDQYYDLRPELAIEDPLGLDDEVGLHPGLRRLHSRGIGVVEGVGPVDGDLSHFSMSARWERGDVKGTNALRTGFLGRLADTLDDGSPLVGASLAGPTPTMTNQHAATLSIGGRDDLWFLQPTDWDEATAFQDGLRRLGSDREGRAGLVGQTYEQLLDLAAALPSDDAEEIDWDQPMLSEGGDLGHQLFLAADLLEADLGLRIVYTGIGGFDTHDDHAWQHPQLMGELDAAIDGFLSRMDAAGRGNEVLVATTSEFGRRVPENGRGLDHGSASTMLLAGAIEAGRLGEPPPLDDLDDDGNLRVTTTFDRYLATLADSWLGIEAASVLPDDPEVLPAFR